MMESVAVNGETAHPVYKWLLSQKEAVFVKPPKTYSQEATLTRRLLLRKGHTIHPLTSLLNTSFLVFRNWNFEKYLINRNGELIKFFPTPATPESIEPHVLELLTRSGISKL